MDFTDRMRRRSGSSWAGMPSAVLGLADLAGYLLATVARRVRRLRRRLVRELALTGSGQEVLPELGDRLLERGGGVVGELVLLRDRVEDLLAVVPQVREELLLELADVGDRDLVELAGGAGPD